MAHKKSPTRCKPELNITSMLDVVLNLIMFFILITNFSTVNLPPEVKSPSFEDSLAHEFGENSKVIVNVVPLGKGEDGTAQEVIFGGQHIAINDLGKLTELLKHELTIKKDVAVSLRADRSIRFDQVQPVMRSISDAGVTTVNLVAEMTGKK